MPRPIRVATPDGKIAEFPEGTSPEAIERALQERFGKPTAPAVAPATTPRPRNPLSAATQMAISPMGPVSRFAQDVANQIDITSRPIREPEPVPVPDRPTGMLETIRDLVGLAPYGEMPLREGNLITAPFESVYHAQQAVPDFVRSLVEQPMATLRGGAAGVIQGIGELSPLDYLELLTGRLAARRGRGPAGSSPGSPAGTPPPGPPPARARLVRPSGEAVATVPTVPSGNPKSTTATSMVDLVRQMVEKPHIPEPGIVNRDMPSILNEARTYREPVDVVELSSPEAAGVKPLGRIIDEKGVSRPATGDYWTVEKRGGPPDGFGDGPGGGDGMVKLPSKPRKKRPEAKMSDITEETPAAEVAEITNRVNRAEPEVLAPRNPNLEALAEQMEKLPTAPNKAVNKALLGETVRGGNRTGTPPASTTPQNVKSVVQLPGDPKLGMPVQRNGKAWTITGVEGDSVILSRGPHSIKSKWAKPAAVVSTAPASPTSTLPVTPDASTGLMAGTKQRLRDIGVPEERINQMTFEQAEATFKAVDDALRAAPGSATNRRVSDRGVGARQPEPNAPINAMASPVEAAMRMRASDPKIDAKGAAMRANSVRDKAGAATRDVGDTALATKPKRTPEEEAAVARANEAMAPTRPDVPDAKVAPVAAAARTEFEQAVAAVQPKPAVKMPSLRDLEKQKKAAPSVPDERVARGKIVSGNIKSASGPEVPVTKLAPAQTRPVASADVDISTLSPSDKVKWQSLSKALPESVKAAARSGDPITVKGDMAQKAMDYRALYEKTQGKVSRAVETMNKPIAEVPPRGSVEEMQVKADEAGKRLPPELKKVIDENGDTSTLIKPENIDDVFAYTGWKERVQSAKARKVSNKRIDDIAQSNIAAAAKEAGEAVPARTSVVERSKEIAKEIALPAAPEVAEIPAKVTERAVAEVLAEAPKPPKGPIRPNITEADIGIPPKGVTPKMWRTIHANAKEAGRLWKERKYLDPRMIDAVRRFWGSEEAARRTGIPRDLVETSSGPGKRKPMEQALRELEEQAEARLKFLMEDPRGFMRAEALIAGTGAISGALAGAALGGESLEDRFASAVSLALMGGLAGFGATKGARAINKSKGKSGGKLAANVEALDTAQMLAGPAAVKASFGAIGGVGAGIWQRLAEGRTQAARAGIRFMMREAAPMWLKIGMGPMTGAIVGGAIGRQGDAGLEGAMTGAVLGLLGGKAFGVKPLASHTAKVGSLTSNVQGPTNKIPQAILNGVLRPFIASDTVGKAALKRMGFSEEESLRMMMNGEPTSMQGQHILHAINSLWIARMFAKFPRVRVGSLERMVEFAPGLSSRFNTRKAHGAEQLSRKALRGRAQYGAGAFAAGTLYGYFRDPGASEAGVAASMTGPAFLLGAAGIATGKGLRKADISQAIGGAALEVGGAVPQVDDTGIRSTLMPKTGNIIPDRWRPGRPMKRFLGIEE